LFAGDGAKRDALAGSSGLRPAAIDDTGTDGVEAVCVGPGGLTTLVRLSPDPGPGASIPNPCPDVWPVAWNEFGLLPNPALCSNVLTVPPSPELTVEATLATPLTVCAKNSLVRPSPLGAQVLSHA